MIERAQREGPNPGGLRAIQRRIDQIRSDTAARELRRPLPSWLERVRAAPNTLLRSALFGVVKPGRRKYVKQMPLPMVGELTLSYTGELLDQADLDIFLQIVHYARQRNVTEPISFPTRQLLREIGRNTGKSDYQWLRSRLVSLSSCGIVIHNGHGETHYTGPILVGVQDDNTGVSAFKLNPHIRALFDNYTELSLF